MVNLNTSRQSPFRTDFDEFCMIFYYELQALLENKSWIECHVVIESEYFNKKDLTKCTGKIYFDRYSILETACEGLSRLSHSKDAKADQMDIVTRCLWGKLSLKERAKEEMERKGLIKLLARIDKDINSCTELVSYLEEQANTCFEAFMTLERESNQEYAAMHACSCLSPCCRR